MSITFSGLATGLDTDSIVNQLMEIERAPIDRLTARRNTATERLNAFFQFKEKLEALKTAASEMTLTSQVRTTKAVASSEGYFTATTSGATSGSYDIAVAQLVQVQKTVSDGFTSKSDSILGTGTITVNGVDIAIDQDNNSLAALAASINEQAGQTGVQASIIDSGDVDAPYHLVLTGKDASTAFTVEASLTGNSETFNTQIAKTAQQAVAYIDGIKVVSDTNAISDAISGATIDLTGVSDIISSGTAEAGVDPSEWADPPTYATTRLDITPDTESLKEKVTTFVTAYNQIIDFINSGYEERFGTGQLLEENTGDSETSDSGEKLLGAVLRGDPTISRVKRQLQNILTDAVDGPGAYAVLSQVGITTQKDGTLKQDNSTLDTALTDKFDDVVALFAGSGDVDGVMKRFNSTLLDMTSYSRGIYANQKSSYLSSVGSIDKQIEVMEARMTKREATLRAQFTAMEQLVSTLNAQGDFLDQQLSNLQTKD
ncbi:MAG: flagellar filament capping protein FliD [Desulfopila sp.]